MENPANWGLAERTIAEAMKSHREGMERGIIGFSVTQSIANALRQAGFDLEDPE